jgi:hypothetical protein
MIETQDSPLKVLDGNLVTMTPYWEDHCDHPEGSYIASFEEILSRDEAEMKCDLYAYEHPRGGTAVCLRFGDEGGDYYSPLNVTDLVSHNFKPYRTAFQVLQSLGNITWQSKHPKCYTAVELYFGAKVDLLTSVRANLCSEAREQLESWRIHAHHMTVNMGFWLEGPLERFEEGANVSLIATHYAMDDRVLAVKVETAVPSANETKHITVAVNPNGGQSHHSNELTDWKPLLAHGEYSGPIDLCGRLKTIDRH